ncbi:MAG: hypothetical protein PUG90_03210 [Clostridia bacterium]|nr:hypothetical protein [Clostridia bacterium]MDY4083290.1 hypothetical protein [Eubacteriales bacterium]
MSNDNIDIDKDSCTEDKDIKQIVQEVLKEQKKSVFWQKVISLALVAIVFLLIVGLLCITETI